MEAAAVRVSVAPVLSARSMRCEQVTQALLGARVEVLEARLRWARIRMEDQYEGWIARSQLGPPLPRSIEWVTMIDLWVNLRTRADSRMPVRQIAFIGVSLPLQDRRPGWLQVALPGGGTGWLEEQRGRVLPPDYAPPAPEPEALIATARRFLGVPYLWGGCSPLGLDCSGFVQLVYRLHGIRLPRDADQQARIGSPVCSDGHESGEASRLRLGDAVFFRSEERTDRISHVGLSLGDGTFIHAAGSDGVRINSLADRPYAERLAGGRRYLPDGSPTGA